jgi:tetraacyldisaccharide-1-P 4'-kinase
MHYTIGEYSDRMTLERGRSALGISQQAEREKTPLVAHIADILAANGDNVCILTRGYGRRDENERVLVADGTRVLVDAETGGDEPVELARKLVGKAIIVADADRVVAAKWAKAKFDVTTVHP